MQKSEVISMGIWGTIQNNLAEITAIVGLLFLLLEIWILGLSTILLLMSGISTISTAFLIWVGVLPATLTTVFSFSGVGAGVLTYFLWTPLKRWQVSEYRDFNIHSDFIGLTFLLTSQFDTSHPISVRYSDANWKLVLAPDHSNSVVNPGDTVKVISVDIGRFIVIPETTQLNSKSNSLQNKRDKYKTRLYYSL